MRPGANASGQEEHGYPVASDQNGMVIEVMSTMRRMTLLLL
jgi:hypothetical protein